MMKDPRSDEQLNTALIEGDAGAGAVIYDRYFKPLRGYFINKVADPGAWDDLVQQTFEVALTRPASYRGDAPYRLWIFGIARNFLRAHYRTASKRAARHDDSIEAIEELSVASLGLGQSTLLAKYAEVQRLIDTLRQIPIKNQQAFELYYWQGMSASEIAVVCECPVGTVRGRLRLAKERLEELGVPSDTLEALARQVHRQIEGESKGDGE